MSDLIDRQAAIDRINGTGYADQIKENLILILRMLPSAQPEPIKINIDHELTKEECEKLRKNMADAPIVLQPECKTGRWIWDDEGYHCSECFFHAYGNTGEILSGYYHFCPNCGTRMESEGENEKEM